jgi:hypothetical protein
MVKEQRAKLEVASSSLKDNILREF